ncbi:hypothetical protein CASFOL_035262 [Castilleja foliolosa]|uniref:Uncharacterized protein n=1 Tax=Castilleja foliolosa TaxID=1961234 RepID=A0ABD3BUG1_9LAMI
MNNGYGESNGHFQPQIREHVPINGYGDNHSHQFQTQNHHRHVRMNGYVNNYSHQFQTQNHQHVTMNGYRDHSHQLQPQNRFDQQVVPNYSAEASPSFIQLYGQNSNLGCMMPSYDQHYYLHEQQQQAPGWVYRQQGDIQNVFWGHNGNDFQQQYPDDESRTKRRRLQHGEFQHDHNQGGHNENNVEQDPHGINSNYVAIDEGLIRENPDDQQQGDLQQGNNNNNIGNNFEQDTDDIISHLCD